MQFVLKMTDIGEVSVHTIQNENGNFICWEHDTAQGVIEVTEIGDRKSVIKEVVDDVCCVESIMSQM